MCCNKMNKNKKLVPIHLTRLNPPWAADLQNETP